MGRSPLGPDGRFGFWEGDIWSRFQSQRLLDPYLFSHLAHGFGFYLLLWLVARRLPIRYRLPPARSRSRRAGRSSRTRLS